METDKDLPAAKQCSDIQEEGIPYAFMSYDGSSSQSAYNPHYRIGNFYSMQSKNIYFYPEIEVERSDEPVDLTTMNNRSDLGSFDFTSPKASHFRGNLTTVEPCAYLPQNDRQHNIVYTEEDKILMVNTDNQHESLLYFSSDKQIEVLKAAKSLFSKRTRTLYHWMYPNISTQQIKQAVTDSWESLNKPEKDFYISQVLGKFGFSQSNLMVNPQLDSIKDIPPPISQTELKERNWKINLELKTAGNRRTGFGSHRAGTFEEYEEHIRRDKRRRGKPKSQRRRFGSNMEFTDDPELSLELNKFALNFNLNKI